MLSWLVKKWVERNANKLLWQASQRSPDFVIDNDYLARWWLVKNVRDFDTLATMNLHRSTKASRWRNTYLHCVNRSDDDRALHDHPWVNISIILSGQYREVYADKSVIRKPGDIVIRLGSTAHRLEVVKGPVWSLFMTGPKYREWGFRCPNGWRHWKQFTAYRLDGDSSRVGRGCGE